MAISVAADRDEAEPTVCSQNERKYFMGRSLTMNTRREFTAVKDMIISALGCCAPFVQDLVRTNVKKICLSFVDAAAAGTECTMHHRTAWRVNTSADALDIWMNKRR